VVVAVGLAADRLPGSKTRDLFGLRFCRGGELKGCWGRGGPWGLCLAAGKKPARWGGGGPVMCAFDGHGHIPTLTGRAGSAWAHFQPSALRIGNRVGCVGSRGQNAAAFSG